MRSKRGELLRHTPEELDLVRSHNLSLCKLICCFIDFCRGRIRHLRPAAVMTAIASPKRHHHPFPGSPIITHHPPHQKQQLVQPAPRNHYVNVCPDLLPPPLPPPSTLLLGPPNTSSREPSVSDSEISTSSISGLSDSSEIRSLFASLPSSHGIRDTNLAGGVGSMTANNPHYNQLKVVEGSKASERTRRILHRPSYLESDSSSSLAESSESLVGLGGGGNNRQKEKEHYDRLKLNLDNLSGNKRAISGAFLYTHNTIQWEES